MNADKFDISSWYKSLREETSVSGRSEFLKIQVHPAIVVTPKDQDEKEARRWVGFSLIEHGGMERTIEAATRYLANLPVPNEYTPVGSYSKRTAWPVGVMFIKYPETYLDRDTSEWQSLDQRHELYKKSSSLVDGRWVIDPNWVAVTESLYNVDGEGVDVSPFQGRFGKDLWVHIRKEADKTYVFDDPETHNAGNTQSYRDRDTGEERVVARRIDVIAAAFDSRAELVDYMKSLGVDVVDGAGSAGNARDVVFPEEWANSQGISEEIWYDDLVPDAMNIIKEGVKEFPKGTFDRRLSEFLENMSSEWQDIPVGSLRQIADVVFGIPF